MIFVQLAVAYATFFMAGGGLTLLLMRGSRRHNMIELFALSTFFGFGLISLLLWIGGFFLSGIALQIFVTLGAVAQGFCGLRAAVRDRPSVAWPRPQTPVEYSLAAIILFILVGMLVISLGQPLGWDASFNWEIKARFAFLNHGVVPETYYTSASTANTHPEYPLFIPFTQLWLDLWLGTPHQFWAKTIFPLFNGAGMFLLALLGTRLSGHRSIGALVAILLFFAPYGAVGTGGVLSGYADLPLGLLYLVAIGYLILYHETGTRRYFFVYLAALALLPWLKREGAVLWVIAAICGGIVLLRQKAPAHEWVNLLPALAIIVAWQLYLFFAGAAPSHDFGLSAASSVSDAFARIVPICMTVVRELLRKEHWSVLWIMVGLALFYQMVRARDLKLLLLATALILPLLLYSGTYVLSAWPDYLSHMHASLPRLVLQLTPIAWLVIASALAWRPGPSGAA
jgi:hypothetical protein